MHISWLRSCLYIVFGLVLLSSFPLLAQAPVASVTGTVTDPSGAVIPQAEVTLTNDKAPPRTAQSDARGLYRLDAVEPGIYTVHASANGFAAFQQQGVNVIAGRSATVDVSLKIEVQEQQVHVADDSVDTSPDKNGGAIVFKGKELDALADNPSDLQSQLQAIAGADPSTGAQFFIDGFSGGKLPPKSSIREIRINQNPYSAQYDSFGMGRIEIFTKPGTDKLHGDFYMNGNDSSFNSRNPFVQVQPPYHSTYIEGDVNGPLSKIVSYFLAARRQSNQSQSFVNAIILDSAFQPQSFAQAVDSPATQIDFNPRFDFQLGKIHTLSLRYSLNRNDQTNSLASQFSLPTQATNTHNTEQVLQVSDTQAYGAKLVNETRFQYIRDRNLQSSTNQDPTLTVQGAFTGGGNNLGDNRDNQDSYELQNYLSLSLGNHFAKFGGRYRAVRDANRSTGGFNGQFIFPSITAYQLTEQGLAQGLDPKVIRANGGGASQFSITTGNPNISVLMQDLGVYLEDDWKIRPNMTLSYGMRFETQTGIHDHADFAPRLGYAWSPGPKNKPPFAVLRGGFGIFYQRFSSTYISNAERQNGTTELQNVYNSPDTFPDFPSITSESTPVSPTVYRISPLIHAPYTVFESVGLDKSVTKQFRVSLNYIHSRGVDQLLTRNINAPLPGTYNPDDPTSGMRPFGGFENIYEYESEGASKRNRFFANASLRTKAITFFGYYMLGYSSANTSGAGSFPSDQYNLHVDYGRSSNDIRHRLFFGGFAKLPYHFSMSPFLIYQSSTPFNITIGQDLNGDAQFNDRPAFATDLSRPSVYRTKWGNFDADPLPSQKIIPINYANGPSYFVANLRITRNFNFGPELPDNNPPPPGNTAQKPAAKKEPERRYNLFLGASAQNLFNYVNPAAPVGVLTSPLFGQSTALGSIFSSTTANRAIYLDIGFSF